MCNMSKKKECLEIFGLCGEAKFLLTFLINLEINFVRKICYNVNEGFS